MCVCVFTHLYYMLSYDIVIDPWNMCIMYRIIFHKFDSTWLGCCLVNCVRILSYVLYNVLCLPTFVYLACFQFSKARRSIIPAGDTSQFISPKEADIAILEEPEHLNWYHHGKRWTDKFNHVVGVVHTNYLEYIKREKNGAIQAFFVKHINNLVIRAYCHKVSVN